MLKPLSALVFTIFMWGAAPVFVRSFSLTTGPSDAMFIRMFSVALMAMAFLPFCGWFIARKDWPRLLLVSWVGIFGYFWGSIYGFNNLSAGLGGIIFATQPLIIAAMAAVIGTERLTAPTLIGFVVSFAGIVFLFSNDFAAFSNSSKALWGAAQIFMCCVAFAVNVVLSPPLVKEYGSLRITILAMILAAVPALPFFRTEIVQVVQSFDVFAWGTLIYLGLLGTIIAVVTWNYAVGLVKPTTAGASLYFIPLLAIITGYIVLGEPITVRMIIGGIIVLAGVAIAQFGAQVWKPALQKADLHK